MNSSFLLIEMEADNKNLVSEECQAQRKSEWSLQAISNHLTFLARGQFRTSEVYQLIVRKNKVLFQKITMSP